MNTAKKLFREHLMAVGRPNPELSQMAINYIEAYLTHLDTLPMVLQEVRMRKLVDIIDTVMTNSEKVFKQINIENCSNKDKVDAIHYFYNEVLKSSSKADDVLGIAQAPSTCGKKCNYCCAIKVSVLKPEAEYLRSIASESQIAKAKLSNCEENEKEFYKVSFADRLCAFNVDGDCSIYESRPLRCRNMNVSSPVSQCMDEETDQVTYIIDLVSEIAMCEADKMFGTEYLRTALSR